MFQNVILLFIYIYLSRLVSLETAREEISVLHTTNIYGTTSMNQDLQTNSSSYWASATNSANANRRHKPTMRIGFCTILTPPFILWGKEGQRVTFGSSSQRHSPFKHEQSFRNQSLRSEAAENQDKSYRPRSCDMCL